MKFNNFYANIVLFFTIFGFLSQNYAQEIKFSGYGSVGYKFYNRNILNGYNQESYYEGKIQADIKYNKKIEGQLDLRGNSLDNSFKLREVTIKFDYWDYLKIKFGNIKKPFGNEQMVNEEELYTIDRSNVHENLSEMGYGGRAVSLMAYYKFNEKRENFPYSYYVSLFHNNNLFKGVVSKFVYHTTWLNYALHYQIQQKGGDNKITTQGFGAGIELDKLGFYTAAEIFYVQDPFEGVLRKLRGEDEKVYSLGTKFLTAYSIIFDGEIVKALEPVLLASYFVPDNKVSKNHVIQTLIGLNIYFHKKVKCRINGDLRLTRNQFNDDYSTKESRAALELQMSF
jgi:hypothetical protein